MTIFNDSHAIQTPFKSCRHYILDSHFYTAPYMSGFDLFHQDYDNHIHIGWFKDENQFYEYLQESFIESEGKKRKPTEDPQIYMLVLGDRKLAQQILSERPTLNIDRIQKTSAL